MSPRVLFAGCAGLPEGDGDEAAVPAELAALGIDAGWAAWDDPDVDFAAADLVVLRATWDYAPRRAEFLEWCASLGNLRNHAAVARWNTDKRYLADLSAAGVPTVPTTLVEPGLNVTWPAGEFVVKPAVRAGSRGAARFAADEHGHADKHLVTLHADGHTALVQPYQSHVDSEGETALVFFGGEYSHAFTKGAMLTGSELDGSGLYVSERLGVARPESAARELADKALDAAAGLLGTARADLLYARVDVVRMADGSFAVLELELTEPSLGFRYADPGAAARFAHCVRNVLDGADDGAPVAGGAP